MARGFDGRIEAAFAKCKEAGEAAFVTFLTAGFPVKEGKKHMHHHNFRHVGLVWGRERVILIWQCVCGCVGKKFSTRIYIMCSANPVCFDSLLIIPGIFLLRRDEIAFLSSISSCYDSYDQTLIIWPSLSLL